MSCLTAAEGLPLRAKGDPQANWRAFVADLHTALPREDESSEEADLYEYDSEENYDHQDEDHEHYDAGAETPPTLQKYEDYRGQKHALDGATVYLNTLNPIRPLDLGDDIPTFFYRDGDGERVIVKTFLRETLDRTKWDGKGRPTEVQMYRKLAKHPRLVKVTAAVEASHFRLPDDDWQVVHTFATGGTLFELEEAADKAREWIPEAFVWQIVKQTLEGLQALYGSGRGHGNACHKSVLLDLNPRTQEGQYPNVLLHNFSVRGFLEKDRDLALRRDLGAFFRCLWQNVIQRSPRLKLKPHPYGKELVGWTWRLMAENDGEPSEMTFAAVMQELYPQINKFIKNSDSSALPLWILAHLKKTHSTITTKADLPSAKLKRNDLLTQCERRFNVWSSREYRGVFAKKPITDLDDFAKAFRLRFILEHFINPEFQRRQPSVWRFRKRHKEPYSQVCSLRDVCERQARVFLKKSIWTVLNKKVSTKEDL